MPVFLFFLFFVFVFVFFLTCFLIVLFNSREELRRKTSTCFIFPVRNERSGSCSRRAGTAGSHLSAVTATHTPGGSRSREGESGTAQRAGTQFATFYSRPCWWFEQEIVSKPNVRKFTVVSESRLLIRCCAKSQQNYHCWKTDSDLDGCHCWFRLFHPG